MALGRRSRGAQSDYFPGFTEITEVGVGRLSTVYRAREDGTNRFVALKLLTIRDASPQAIESFERESIALGAVSSHPNIVTLYRSFRAADGRPVLVLELCRGSAGDYASTEQGLAAPQVVALGIKIAGALETAHRAGILHRDVKPQNILITEYGEPALADFGVAMLKSSTQTTVGLFDFTTLHAAPELLEGGDTSPATDVYELASCLYQLLAGRPAFRAYDGESPASVILRILRDPVQPLPIAAVPPALSDLLLDAMSKDQGNRPHSAAEFAAALAAIEVEHSWSRTPLLIRDAHANSARPPPVPAPHAAPPPAAAQPAPPVAPGDSTIFGVGRYPIPPAFTADGAPPPQGAGQVPTWSVRATSPAPPQTQVAGTPGAGRPNAPDAGGRVTIRSGRSSMTVDGIGIGLRTGLRRCDIPWRAVHRFEPRFEGPGVDAFGRLVVITDRGPVDLPATRRPTADLRALHGQLDAYHRRAGTTPH